MYDPTTPAIAFHGHALVAEGPLAEVARGVKHYAESHTEAMVLVFNATTSRPIELDLRGSADEVVARLQGSAPAADCAVTDAIMPADDRADEHPAKRGPGRPKLGVVAREVTLLPRHWEWLSAQPGGASVTLRKLVEQARKETAKDTRLRDARDAVYRFIFAVGGDLPDFEEVTRALYAGDTGRFDMLTEGWPADVRVHARRLATMTSEDTEE